MVAATLYLIQDINCYQWVRFKALYYIITPYISTFTEARLWYKQYSEHNIKFGFRWLVETQVKVEAPIGYLECFIPKRINITGNEL